MIAFPKPVSSDIPDWHDWFLSMVPRIVQQAKIAFRGLDAAAMEDAIAEVVVNACVAFARLVELGKTELAFASVLARYGVAQFHYGRSVGNRLNIHDVLSKYAQQKKGIKVKRLDHYNEEEGQWVEAVVQDTRSSPVPDIVSFRLDFAEWLGRLPRRNRCIAESLAIGNRTKDVSRRFGVSEGRITQLRRELANSWVTFRGDDGTSSRIDPVAV